MNIKSVLVILLVLGISSIVSFYQLPSAKAIIWIGGHIISDTTWTPADTYGLINNTYVDPKITLTILPGVNVQLADSSSLIIQGSLNATGTEAEPIFFTSSRITPSPGAWNTIAFQANSTERFLLEHVKVVYAVDGVSVQSLAPTVIQRSSIANCSNSGIMLIGKTNVTIRENTIKANKYGITTDSADTHSGIVITGNTILSSQNYGIYIESNIDIYSVSVSSNIVSSNGGNGIYLTSSYIYNVSVLSDTVLSNGGSGIYLTSIWSLYNVSVSSNMVSSNGGNGIYIESNIDIYSVSVSSNTVLSNSGSGIYLTSYGRGRGNGYIYNVSVSSDTVLSNGGNGICLFVEYGNVYNVSVSSNAVSSNGGNGIYIHAGRNVVHIDGGYLYNVSVSSNLISSNKGSGTCVEASTHNTGSTYDFTMSANVISTNYQKGLWVNGGINGNLSRNSLSYNQYGIFYATTNNNLANYNDIYRNTFGINVSFGATVNAEYNYWGDSAGPHQPSLNPEGKGNPVNGNGVDLVFIPFLSSNQSKIDQRPVAALSVDKKTPNVNETVTFNATNSTSDGRIGYYFFDFGDGHNSNWTTLPVVTYVYAHNGTYYATVTIMDDYGLTSNNTQQVKVQIIVALEFPPYLILPLFMIATFLAAVVLRRRPKCARVRARLRGVRVRGCG